jgi:hypothetical protein
MGDREMTTRADKERLTVALAMLLAVLGLIGAGQSGALEGRHTGLAEAAANPAP